MTTRTENVLLSMGELLSMKKISIGGVRCQRGRQTTVSTLSAAGSRDGTVMVSVWDLAVLVVMSQ